MNLRIITVGKLKERFWADACKEYTKRLSRYHTIEIIEVADERAPQHLSAADEKNVLLLEGKRIQSYLREQAVLVTLCIEGQMLTSVELSKMLDDYALSGVNKIDFVIGGSLGLSQEITQKADLRLSFSRMTFAHQLFRVMLLEQLYRAAKISSGEPYHK